MNLNGSAIPDPTAFTIQPIDIVVKRRMSDGTMKCEVVCNKKRYGIIYATITPANLKTFITLATAGAGVAFQYTRNGVTENKAVMVKLPAYSAFSQTPEIWKNIFISMEEI
jgi:hypothetical protein